MKETQRCGETLNIIRRSFSTAALEIPGKMLYFPSKMRIVLKICCFCGVVNLQQKRPCKNYPASTGKGFEHFLLGWVSPDRYVAMYRWRFEFFNQHRLVQRRNVDLLRFHEFAMLSQISRWFLWRSRMFRWMLIFGSCGCGVSWASRVWKCSVVEVERGVLVQEWASAGIELRRWRRLVAYRCSRENSSRRSF